MDPRTFKNRLIELLEPAAAEHGFELVDIALKGDHAHPTVAVFLDTLGDEAVSLDLLCEANVWIDEILDQAEAFEDAYVLEVSSPGIERPLRTQADFAAHVGKRVVLKRETSTGSKKRVAGILKAFDGTTLTINVDDQERTVLFDDVITARLNEPFDFGKKDER